MLNVMAALRFSTLSSSTSLHCKSLLHCSRLSSSAAFSNLRSLSYPITIPYKWRKKIKNGICRADFSKDLPFGAALGACVLSSLLLPVDKREDDETEGSAFDSADARLAAMGVISFIPFFNWLCWVFAWLDTGKRRYAVYSFAYLIPYIRTNLSINPEDSWLPITSIVLCIIHVQLEASLTNGDIQRFEFLNKAAEKLSSMKRKTSQFDVNHMDLQDEDIEREKNPQRGDRSLRNEIPSWNAPKKPAEHHEKDKRDHSDGDEGWEQ